MTVGIKVGFRVEWGRGAKVLQVTKKWRDMGEKEGSLRRARQLGCAGQCAGQLRARFLRRGGVEEGGTGRGGADEARRRRGRWSMTRWPRTDFAGSLMAG